VQVVKYGDDHFFDGLGIISRTPANWWTARHDIDFLLGVIKHGSGKHDAIRDDIALPFHSLLKKVDENGIALNTWPQPLHLGVRFKSLLQAIRARDERGSGKDESAGTKRKIESGAPSSQDLKRLRKEERQMWEQSKSGKWTERESTDLMDAMMAFGTIRLESWGAVRTLYPALAASTDDALKQHMNQILVHLQSEAGQLQQTPQLNRLKSRLSLIGFVKKVAEHPAVYHRLRMAHSTRDVPQWWRCGEHDQALLYGLLVHGVGNWQRICTDPTVGIQLEYKPDTAEWIMARVMYILRLFSQNATEGEGLSSSNSFPHLSLNPLPAIVSAISDKSLPSGEIRDGARAVSALTLASIPATNTASASPFVASPTPLVPALAPAPVPAPPVERQAAHGYPAAAQASPDHSTSSRIDPHSTMLPSAQHNQYQLQINQQQQHAAMLASSQQLTSSHHGWQSHHQLQVSQDRLSVNNQRDERDPEVLLREYDTSLHYRVRPQSEEPSSQKPRCDAASTLILKTRAQSRIFLSGMRF
jgi:hypothetical protein